MSGAPTSAGDVPAEAYRHLRSDEAMTSDHRLLRRVVLRNYKSIAGCDVSLAQLSFLVGPNESGKSNFLDGLRFIADALRHSIDHAMRDRGGINEVRRRSLGRPNHVGIRVEFAVAGSSGRYAFTVGAKPRGGYEMQREECLVVRSDSSEDDYCIVESGRVSKYRRARGRSPPRRFGRAHRQSSGRCRVRPHPRDQPRVVATRGACARSPRQGTWAKPRKLASSLRLRGRGHATIEVTTAPLPRMEVAHRDTVDRTLTRHTDFANL